MSFETELLEDSIELKKDIIALREAKSNIAEERDMLQYKNERLNALLLKTKFGKTVTIFEDIRTILLTATFAVLITIWIMT